MNQKLDRIIELLEKIRNSDKKYEKGKRMANYIKELREKVGHDYVFLNFAGGCVFNKEGEVLLQKEATLTLGAFQGRNGDRRIGCGNCNSRNKRNRV